MFCIFLDMTYVIISWNFVFDDLVDRMRSRYEVYFPNIISLLEQEMPVVQYIGEKPVTLYIDLENTFHIHEFDVINEEKTRVNKYDFMLGYEHNPPKEINGLEDQSQENVVDHQKEEGKYYKMFEIVGEVQFIYE